MTLEKGKSYGQEQIQQTLQDKSRTRLNNPAPHQAPQRERVSRSTIPSSRRGGGGASGAAAGAGAGAGGAAGGGGSRTRTRRWKSLIRPDVNMGVPQLMLILEPNIVWEHTKAFVSAVGREIESSVTPGEFFEGWHKGGRRAHGVYEGSYWELMGDCDELAELLRKLAKAPALLEEPPLELPPPPELPAWEAFKPNLHLIPSPPQLPPLKLPPFRAPILEPEPPFVEPEYLPLPVVPPVPKEEPLPIFIPPEFLQVEPLVEPEYEDPPPPTTPDPPPPPAFGHPKHGHDWSGLRPHQLELPNRESFLAEAATQRIMDTSRFVHPPNNLPLVPELELLDDDILRGLDLEPIPRLELAWMGGPEPDPPFASAPASPAALSRAPSRPASASPAAPSTRSPLSGQRPQTASATSTRTAMYDGVPRPMSAGAPRGATSPDGDDGGPKPRIRSGRRGGGSGLSQRPSLPQTQTVVKTPEEVAWEEARSVASEASGTPRVWVNFSAPFADLPPIMMPPRPEPGPEPLPEDFPHELLEELPAFAPPALLEAPLYTEPPQFTPQWAAPCEPRPAGFLRGSAPVLICDVSGTMNPRQQGRFRELKRCAVELLDPEGEIATAAAGFDVITFAGGAWSWSAGYGERMAVLQSSQVPYSGRQVGGRYSSKSPQGPAAITAAAAAAGGGGGGAASRSNSPERRYGASPASASWPASASSGPSLALMPTQPDLLSDAQRWVANWPDAVGQTNLMSAFALAEQHAAADCWYVLSDGLAHDQQVCLEYLARRADAGCLPVIHAVGFIPAEASPDTSGERFLRGLAELTGGSYQRYTPDIHKVWVSGQGFVRFDLRSETAEAREERQWAEKQLRAERMKNLRLGIAEALEVTMERVMTLHMQLRVFPAVRANEAAVAEALRRHEVATESVRLTNERRLAEANAAFQAAVEATRGRNQAKVDAARENFLQAHGEWERSYLDRLQDWEDAKASLERQREEQLAAARAAASPAATPTRAAGSPQPVMASGSGSGGGSRPTSATVAAALLRSRAGNFLLPPSPSADLAEHRAAAAAAEYDAAMGLERLADKLSYSYSPLHTPPGSRPMSAVIAGSRPLSAVKAETWPGSGGAAGGGASEYLEAITEDLTEASAPLDAVYAGGGADAAAGGGGGADGTLDDDGLDVRPSKGRGGRAGGRDQDSAGGGSGRPSSGLPPPATSSRPVSGRGSAGGGSRLGSARSVASSGASAGRKAAALGVLQEVSSTLPPPLPEPSKPLAPLRGEKSDDFKRRLFPPEVVDAHDDANSARLDEIRQRWEDIVAADLAEGQGRKMAAMKRNAARVAQYTQAVYEAYANGLIRDVVYGGAVRVAANMAIMDNAEARYQAEVARINAENAKLRQLHAEEMGEKRAKEEAHAQAHRRWQDGKAAAARQHEADREKARAEHEANVTRIKADWRAKTQEILELNDARLSEAEAVHEALVAAVKETNRRHKEEHSEQLRGRKEVEMTNNSRLAEARAVHKVRLEARAADNERLIRNAMEEHQALCVRLGEEYEEGRAQAESDHTELCAFLRAANEQLTEEARRRYQEALAEVQAAYEAECELVREAHARDLERVKRYNQEIWPKVHVARLAQAELGRVQAFAEHIRFCANKFEMGVNLLPNTPNYDRVVEMQALTEALAKAFPDQSPSSLPWPEHERRLEPGTGWVTAPAARSLTYRDPMDLINRIAKGKAHPASASPANSPSRGDSPAAARGQTAPGSVAAAALAAEGGGGGDAGPGPSGLRTSSGSIEDSPHHQHQHHHYSSIQRQMSSGAGAGGGGLPYAPRHVTRPLSAGRARFASVLYSNGDAAAGGGGGISRPMSAAVTAPVSARVEAWGAAAAAAAAVSALSSPGGAGALRPQTAGGAGYQNPSAWRRSNTSLLRAGSPRNGYAASNLGGGGGAATSPSMAAAAAAAAAATSAIGGLMSRPGTARPGTAAAGGGVGSGSVSSSRPRSAGPASRPPARVAVDVAPLQASVARAKAQAGSHVLTSAALAGFTRDVPKLRYPEVDVPQALTIAGSLRSG